MRIAGLVEACEGRGAGTPYGVTEWARRGVAPLVAAGHCERVHMSRESTPLTVADIEAALVLALPLVHLPDEVSGECQIEVRATPGLVSQPTGVHVVLDRGRVVSCAPGFLAAAPTRVAGSAMDWFDAIKAGEPERLELLSGALPEALVSGLQRCLRAAAAAPSLELGGIPRPSRTAAPGPGAPARVLLLRRRKGPGPHRSVPAASRADAPCDHGRPGRRFWRRWRRRRGRWRPARRAACRSRRDRARGRRVKRLKSSRKIVREIGPRAASSRIITLPATGSAANHPSVAASVSRTRSSHGPGVV